MNKEYPDHPNKPDIWKFVLYISGDMAISKQVESTLHYLLDKYVPDNYTLDVVDIRKNSLSLPSDVLAIPTVIRTSPLPGRRVIGDLSDLEKSVKGLGLDDFKIFSYDPEKS